MNSKIFAAGLVLTCAALALGGLALSQDDAFPAGKMTPEMQKAWERFAELCTPGENHEFLAQFIGEWDVEIGVVMPGSPRQGSKGWAKCSWLLKGRWLLRETKGELMGHPLHSFDIIGYDNYKKKFVTAMVSNQSTMLLTAEGLLDQDGNIRSWGTMDEPLTDEHDKMVEYTTRIVNEDKHVLEVHDLIIGAPNTKVLEFVFTRKG